MWKKGIITSAKAFYYDVAQMISLFQDYLDNPRQFHVLRDDRLINCPTSTSRKSTRSWCAPKRLRFAPVDDGPREMAAVAAADPPKLVRTASHGAVMNRIDHGADAATVSSVHRIETTAIGR
jgi:hypothetical protein